MNSPGLTTPHVGHPQLAERINRTRGTGIVGVAECGSHNPVHGSNYWMAEPEGTLLYYSEVAVTENKPGEVGAARNAIYRVNLTLVSADLLG